MSLQITLDDLRQAVDESFEKGWWNETTPRNSIAQTIYQYLTDSEVGGMGMMTSQDDANRVQTALSNSVLGVDPDGQTCPGDSLREKINNCLPTWMGVLPSGSATQPETSSVTLTVPLPNDAEIKKAIDDMFRSAYVERCYRDSKAIFSERFPDVINLDNIQDKQQFFKIFGEQCMEGLQNQTLFTLFPEASKFSNPDLNSIDKERFQERIDLFNREFMRFVDYISDRFVGGPSSAEGDDWLSGLPSTVPAASNDPDAQTGGGSEYSDAPPNPVKDKFLGHLEPAARGGAIFGIVAAIIIVILAIVFGIRKFKWKTR